MADFGPAFENRDNLVVGPLALIGGAAFTTPSVVRGFGGQKFPLLVKAGHQVTVQVPREARGVAGLGYGPLPEGEITIDEAHHTVTFVACRQDEPSGSSANGPVTFWSGAIVATHPACVPLDVYVDGDAAPRRVTISLGVHCPG